eukprot:UN33199
MKTNEILIKQQVGLWEAVTGCCEQSNKYQVYDSLENGQIIFNMAEESECKERCFCHPNHTFNLRLVAGEAGSAGLIDWSNPLSDKGEVNMKERMMHRLGCCTKIGYAVLHAVRIPRKKLKYSQIATNFNMYWKRKVVEPVMTLV